MRRRPRPKHVVSWPHQLAWQVKQCASVAVHCALEHRFHPVRKWRFDVAWPAKMLACEVDGGGFIQGRHSRGLGMEKDNEKMAHALLLGWKVLRVTPRQVQNGQALKWIEQLLVRGVSDVDELCEGRDK